MNTFMRRLVTALIIVVLALAGAWLRSKNRAQAMAAAHAPLAILAKAAFDSERRAQVTAGRLAGMLAEAEDDEKEAARISDLPTDIRPEAIRARRQWAGFAARYNLSAEQLNRLAGAIADKPSSAIPAQRQENIRAILGPDGYQAYQEYLPVVLMSSYVEFQLQPHLRGWGVDLTPQQGEQLARMLAAAPVDGEYPVAGAVERTNVAEIKEPIGGGSNLWAEFSDGPIVFRMNNAALRQASTFLAAEQVEAIRQFMIRKRAYDEVRVATLRHFTETLQASNAAVPNNAAGQAVLYAASAEVVTSSGQAAAAVRAAQAAFPAP